MLILSFVDVFCQSHACQSLASVCADNGWVHKERQTSASPTAFSSINRSLKSPGHFNLLVCLESPLDAAAGAFP